MNIIQITPGAGKMYCGNCCRDNALVAALRKLGHRATMIPLYLPLTLDEPDQSQGTPIFFGGINVYLEQKSALFREAPDWFHHLMASPRLLRWAAGKTAKTRAEDLGDLTLSMLRGEEGNQARELDELIDWLRKVEYPPDMICLSNALLLGLAKQLKVELNVPVICTLQGEDSFLDALPTTYRAACWQTLTERAEWVDAFIAPSRYFADLMSKRLNLAPNRVQVVHNGLDLAGYGDLPSTDADAQGGGGNGGSPALGFFARMCPEKGLDTVVDAFLILRQRNRVKDLKLRVGGSCGPADEKFVGTLKQRLEERQLLDQAEFHPNLDHAAKIAFLRELTIFSVPAIYGEAFGLYVLEALAAGVPVVQPDTAAFPEIIAATQGGVICPPRDANALAVALETLLLDADRLRALGRAGQAAVFEKFNADVMARNSLNIFEQVVAARSSRTAAVPSSIS